MKNINFKKGQSQVLGIFIGITLTLTILYGYHYYLKIENQKLEKERARAEENLRPKKQELTPEQKKEESLKLQEMRERAEIANDKSKRKEWETSKAGKLCATHPDWRMQECRSVADKKIWIGMSYDMLVVSYGSKPDQSRPSADKNGQKMKWCWFNMSPHCFYDNNNDMRIDAYDSDMDIF